MNVAKFQLCLNHEDPDIVQSGLEEFRDQVLLEHGLTELFGYNGRPVRRMDIVQSVPNVGKHAWCPTGLLAQYIKSSPRANELFVLWMLPQRDEVVSLCTAHMSCLSVVLFCSQADEEFSGIVVRRILDEFTVSIERQLSTGHVKLVHATLGLLLAMCKLAEMYSRPVYFKLLKPSPTIVTLVQKGKDVKWLLESGDVVWKLETDSRYLINLILREVMLHADESLVQDVLLNESLVRRVAASVHKDSAEGLVNTLSIFNEVFSKSLWEQNYSLYRILEPKVLQRLLEITSKDTESSDIAAAFCQQLCRKLNKDLATNLNSQASQHMKSRSVCFSTATSLMQLLRGHEDDHHKELQLHLLQSLPSLLPEAIASMHVSWSDVQPTPPYKAALAHMTALLEGIQTTSDAEKSLRRVLRKSSINEQSTKQVIDAIEAYVRSFLPLGLTKKEFAKLISHSDPDLRRAGLKMLYLVLCRLRNGIWEAEDISESDILFVEPYLAVVLSNIVPDGGVIVSILARFAGNTVGNLPEPTALDEERELRHLAFGLLGAILACWPNFAATTDLMTVFNDALPAHLISANSNGFQTELDMSTSECVIQTLSILRLALKANSFLERWFGNKEECVKLITNLIVSPSWTTSTRIDPLLKLLLLATASDLKCSEAANTFLMELLRRSQLFAGYGAADVELSFEKLSWLCCLRSANASFAVGILNAVLKVGFHWSVELSLHADRLFRSLDCCDLSVFDCFPCSPVTLAALSLTSVKLFAIAPSLPGHIKSKLQDTHDEHSLDFFEKFRKGFVNDAALVVLDVLSRRILASPFQIQILNIFTRVMGRIGTVNNWERGLDEIVSWIHGVELVPGNYSWKNPTIQRVVETKQQMSLESQEALSPICDLIHVQNSSPALDSWVVSCTKSHIDSFDLAVAAKQLYTLCTSNRMIPELSSLIDSFRHQTERVSGLDAAKGLAFVAANWSTKLLFSIDYRGILLRQLIVAVILVNQRLNCTSAPLTDLSTRIAESALEHSVTESDVVNLLWVVVSLMEKSTLRFQLIDHMWSNAAFEDCGSPVVSHTQIFAGWALRQTDASTKAILNLASRDHLKRAIVDSIHDNKSRHLRLKRLCIDVDFNSFGKSAMTSFIDPTSFVSIHEWIECRNKFPVTAMVVSCGITCLTLNCIDGAEIELLAAARSSSVSAAVPDFCSAMSKELMCCQELAQENLIGNLIDITNHVQPFDEQSAQEMVTLILSLSTWRLIRVALSRSGSLDHSQRLFDAWLQCWKESLMRCLDVDLVRREPVATIDSSKLACRCKVFVKLTNIELDQLPSWAEEKLISIRTTFVKRMNKWIKTILKLALGEDQEALSDVFGSLMVLFSPTSMLRSNTIWSFLLRGRSSSDYFYPTMTIQMVLSHSRFATVLNSQLSSLKEVGVLKFVLQLVSLIQSSRLEHLPVATANSLVESLMPHYGGTVNLKDRIILRIFYVLKSMGFLSDLCSLKLRLSGSDSSRFKSKSRDLHYLFSVLDYGRVQATITNLPKHRTIMPSPFPFEGVDAYNLFLKEFKNIEDELHFNLDPIVDPVNDPSTLTFVDVCEIGSDSCDPTFWIPSIYFWLQGSDISFRLLAQTGVVALVLVFLASESMLIRTYSLACLQQLSKLLLDQTVEKDPLFRERPQFILLFNFIRNALSANNFCPQFPTATSSFLANASITLLQPNHEFYGKVNKYLLSRPFCDMKDIPLMDLFLTEGGSDSILHILRVLRDSLRSAEDHRSLCRKNAYSRFLLLFHISLRKDIRCGHATADLIERSLCNRDSARYLIERCRIGSWISQNINIGLQNTADNMPMTLLLRHLDLYNRQVGATFLLISEGLLSKDWFEDIVSQVAMLLSVTTEYLIRSSDHNSLLEFCRRVSAVLWEVALTTAHLRIPFSIGGCIFRFCNYVEDSLQNLPGWMDVLLTIQLLISRARATDVQRTQAMKASNSFSSNILRRLLPNCSSSSSISLVEEIRIHSDDVSSHSSAPSAIQILLRTKTMLSELINESYSYQNTFSQAVWDEFGRTDVPVFPSVLQLSDHVFLNLIVAVLHKLREILPTVNDHRSNMELLRFCLLIDRLFSKYELCRIGIRDGDNESLYAAFAIGDYSRMTDRNEQEALKTDLTLAILVTFAGCNIVQESMKSEIIRNLTRILSVASQHGTCGFKSTIPIPDVVEKIRYLVLNLVSSYDRERKDDGVDSLSEVWNELHVYCNKMESSTLPATVDAQLRVDFGEELREEQVFGMSFKKPRLSEHDDISLPDGSGNDENEESDGADMESQSDSADSGDSETSDFLDM